MNGWLLLNKPISISSAGALNKVKRFFAPSKVGHAGTLDPFASGLMIVAIGQATKLINHVMNYDKSYQFTIAWGRSTDTIDPTGAVVAESSEVPSLLKLNEALLEFPTNDWLMQVPPQYSAIKLSGKRAYQMARSGQQFTIPAREVFLHSLELLSHGNQKSSFALNCGKGFYVRSLARDIIAKTGGCGHVAELQRTAIGKFTLSQSITLDYLLDMLHNPDQHSAFLKPVHALLDDILVLHVDEFKIRALRCGQSIILGSESFDHGQKIIVCDSISGEVTALCEVQGTHLRPLRVLNTTFNYE